MTLVNGGFRSQARVSSVAILLWVFGDVGPIPFDTVGTVTFEYVDVDATYELVVAAGRPRGRLRSVTTRVGPISTSFTGLHGWILNNIVVPLAQNMLRDIVRDTLQLYITNNSAGVLDAVVSGLDVSTLAPFAVPRLDGGASLDLSFGVGFSSISTTSSRMLATIGTRFQTTPAHSRPSLGAPLPPGQVLLDPVSSGEAVAVGVHSGVFNHALHAFWRGGYFDADLSEGDLNGLIPAGVVLRTTAGLPPVVTIRADDRVEVAMGAVQVHVEHPALLAAPVDAGVGGRVSCDRRLAGNDLILEDCRVDELHISPGVTLDSSTAAQLEELLAAAVNEILSTAVNDALPALPIPGFRIPASLGQYGLPVGVVLGVVNPVLTTQGPHFVLRGGFGIR